MSVDFIKNRRNAKHLLSAQKQYKDLSYFISSKVQEDVNMEYLKQYVNRNYGGNDQFLNWVKTVFRKDNFMSFFKYLRFPLVSARLVNDEIKPQLQRVFFAEDSFFKYIINGKEVGDPKEIKGEFYNNEFLKAILFKYNDVVVHDLDNINEPFKEIISINSIVAIESENGVISEIAYLSCITVDGEEINGFSYINDEKYIFYDSKYELVLEAAHDLGVCPADWVSSENFCIDNDIVKKSLFSFVKNDLEEFVFLKTLQKMTEPNGAIPVVTKLKTTEVSKEGVNVGSESDKEPMSFNSITSQKADIGGIVRGSDSQLQTGTQVSVPINKKDDGSIDMDVVKYYFQFHYIPTESLKYLNDRLNELRESIIKSVLGDYQESDVSAKNELQVSKSFVNKEDRLRWVSNELSRIKKLSDLKTLSLKYGRENVDVDVFFGSDFFLETQKQMYASFENAPNGVERRNILIKISQKRNKFNFSKAERDVILYKILPYISDDDFKMALDNMSVMPLMFEYQTRFNYWLSVFEANYGEIEIFWNSLDIKEAEKIMLINNLITQLITSETGITKATPIPQKQQIAN